MTTATWFILIGLLLLVVGFTFSWLKSLPITSAIVYLLVGCIVGPMGFGLFHFNPLKESALLELLTELAVLVSLYCAGVKMPAPITWPRWRTPVLLAVVSMSLTVGLVTLFGYYWLALPLGAAVLLGAVLAPTDPVLATEVQVRHADDSDRLRFALTCEAGINDGSAFPFVMLGLGLLGLHDLGDAGSRWLVVDVLWATLAGIGIGVATGWVAGQLVHRLRTAFAGMTFLESFLGLGLIAFAYGICLLAGAWGFLGVFSAAIALRHTEIRLAARKEASIRRASADGAVDSKSSDLHMHVSESSLVFNEHLERISEIVLVLMIGGSLFWNSWSWRAVVFAAFLFLVARPISVYLGLLGSGTSMRIRHLSGWFGVRGIGSMYYLMYAIQHGLPQDLALELLHLTLVAVALSILVHGLSVKPAFALFWRS
ncbi:MAG: sodium:proton antiporter [Xanthomonadales bacterium]|nr:sodium:proton antiporter [Xanthomonadales bacterium]|tara:strand:- start:2710 stop:3990 length:1281 start_codon:yes stop_codon:yes gene_type:complete